MRILYCLIIVIVLSGCGVSKKTYEMALNDIQRLTAESDSQRQKISGLEKDLATAKAEISGLAAKKADAEGALEKMKRELDDCKVGNAERDARIKELEKKEKELVQLKVDIRTVEERTSDLMEMIKKISK